MTAIKLTREQQERLIQYALDHILGDVPRRKYTRTNGSPLAEAVNGHHHGNGWTPERRAAVSKKMVATWEKRKNGEKPHGKESVRERRERSAELLKKFSPDEPRVIKSMSMGSLVRRGYLKKKGDGYIRTAKPYEP